jgi:hypothetical protein
MSEIDRQRAAVVAEAKSWLRTPYHHAAMCKGAGVDCAMLPAAVYRAAGLIPDFRIDHYPPDWHLHRDAERYLGIVTRYATEIPAPTGPGDFVLYRWGRAFAHGAIILDWPVIIHAMTGIGVTLDNGEGGRLTGRARRFFTLWGGPDGLSDRQRENAGDAADGGVGRVDPKLGLWRPDSDRLRSNAADRQSDLVRRFSGDRADIEPIQRR